jgi:hypothetical protein
MSSGNRIRGRLEPSAGFVINVPLETAACLEQIGISFWVLQESSWDDLTVLIPTSPGRAASGMGGLLGGTKIRRKVLTARDLKRFATRSVPGPRGCGGCRATIQNVLTHGELRKALLCGLLSHMLHIFVYDHAATVHDVLRSRR